MQYRVLTPLRRDGRNVPAGALIEMTEKEAAQLLEMQALEPIHKRFVRQVVVPGTSA